MHDVGKIVLGSVTTIAVNSGIQFLIVKDTIRPSKVVPSGVDANDFLALGLELGVSAGSYALFGALPAMLGAVEAISFFGLKLAGVLPILTTKEKAFQEVISNPSPVLPTKAPAESAKTAPAAPKAPESGSAAPEDFYSREDFANPEEFANAEDFANPETLSGTPRLIR